MKIKIISIFILSTLILKSCGLPGPTETKVTLPSIDKIVSGMSSPLVASDGPTPDPTDLFIFSLSAYSHEHQLYVQKTFSSDRSNNNDSEFNLPNGIWDFYGVVYYNTVNPDNTAITQWIKCFYKQESLDGLSKEINLSLNQESCHHINNSVHQELPKISFRRFYDGSDDHLGTDRSIQVSLVSIKPFNINSDDQLQIESKVSLYPMDSGDMAEGKCYPLATTIGAWTTKNDDYFRVPFSPDTANLLPIAMFIEGFYDEECKVPNPKTGKVVFNNRLSRNYTLDQSNLNFIREITHRDFSDPDPSEIFWIPLSSSGDFCINNENCDFNTQSCDTITRQCTLGSGGGGGG